MRLILKTFLLLLTAIHSFSAEADTSTKLPVAARVFTSGIHDIYLKQMQDFVHQAEITYPVLVSYTRDELRSEFQKEAFDLFQLIKQGALASVPEIKQEYHRKVIGQLREVIRLKDKCPEINDFITNSFLCFVDDLCLWMFTAPQLLDPMQDYMAATFPDAFPKKVIEGAWVGQLAALHGSIDPVEYGGVERTSPGLHNAHLNGDVPFFLYTIPTSRKEIRLIRTSNTTFDFFAEDGSVATAVIPEFANYLRAMADLGKTHLYVNYIERQKDGGSREISLLEGFENDPYFGLAVHVVSLARNSPFYKQESSFSEIEDAEEFKAVFIEELFADSKEGHYHWPKVVDLIGWRGTVRAILDEVHVAYFSRQAMLSVEERQQFIDVAYIKMVRKLMELLQPDVANLSCAISIDRGPTGFTLFYIDHLLQEKGRLDLVDLKKIATLVNAPGVLVRNRSVVPSHQQRFIGAAGLMQDVHERVRAGSSVE